MNLVPAICTQCNGIVDVDPSRESAVCRFCGTVFAVENAINNYNIQNNYYQTTYNVQNNVHNAKRGAVESVLGFVERKKDAEERRIAEAKRLAEEQKRLAKEKRKKAMPVYGCIIFVLGLLLLFRAFSYRSGATAIFALIVLLIGFTIVSKEVTTRKKAKKYRNYTDMIVNQHTTNIDEIASAFSLPYSVVEKDLKKMIGSGFLRGAYIHQGNRQIIINQPQQVARTAPIQQNFAQQPPVAQNQPKMVLCKSCGANNTFTSDGVHECEYCGASIK
jgi:hypothetical protein